MFDYFTRLMKGSVEHELEHELVNVAVLRDEAEKGGSGFLASSVVVRSGPGSLLFLDVGLDLSAVEEPVLGGDLGHLERVLQDLSPGENDIKVGLDILNLLARANSFGEHPDEVADVSGELHEVEVLDVSKSGLGVISEGLEVGHAAFELGAVVVASETHKKTSSEVRDDLLEGRKVEPAFLHGQKSEGDIGSHFSNTEVISFGVVVLLLLNIILDVGSVEEPVLGGNFGNLDRVLEDLSPVFHDFDVGLELSELTTARDSVWEHPDDVTKVRSNFQEVASLGISNDSEEIIGDRGKVSHAAFKLLFVVIAGEALDEASGEVRDEGVDRGQSHAFESRGDGANGERHKSSKVLARLEVSAGGPVSLDGFDVSLNISLVEEVVLADGGGELLGILEN